jgi:uncharacterized protein YjbJ (UPF0337 family)
MADDGTFDEAKGRAKEAVGDLTDDESLQGEGKVDRAAADAKGFIGNMADKVKGLFRRS